MASASAGAVSARTTPRPTRSSIPSQPREVATTGRPVSSASMILSLVPPPARSGATTTRTAPGRGGRQGQCRSRAHSRSPGRARPGRDPSRRGGAAPRAPPPAPGPDVPASHTAASTFGAHPMVATKATVGSVAPGSTPVGSRPFGQTRTDRASPVSLALSSSLTTTTWSNSPIVRRSIRRGRPPPHGEGRRGPLAGAGVAGDESRLHVVEVEHRVFAGRSRTKGTNCWYSTCSRSTAFSAAARGRSRASPGSRTVPPRHCASRDPAGDPGGVTRHGTARTSMPRSRRPALSAVPSSYPHSTTRPARRDGGRSPATADDPRCCPATAGTSSP